jgi:hypothetical protein
VITLFADNNIDDNEATTTVTAAAPPVVDEPGDGITEGNPSFTG